MNTDITKMTSEEISPYLNEIKFKEELEKS